MLLQNVKALRVQVFISCCLYLGFLLDGYSIGWTAPVVAKLRNPEENPLPYNISETSITWIASLGYIGGLGSYVAGFLSNIIGRKPCLIISGSVLCASYVIFAFSRSVVTMLVARFVCGLGQTSFTLISLLYIGEISSATIRGALMTAAGVFINLGAVTVYIVGPFTTYRGVNYVAIGLGALFIISCLFIPETPVYYVIKGRIEEAKSCLCRLKRTEDIDGELQKMIANVQNKESKRVLWYQLVFHKNNRRALFITVIMYFFQMNSGIIFFMFFATTIFKDAGSSVEPFLATIITGLTSLVGSLLAPITIEKYGRRLLLIVSTVGCCICMTVMGVYFYLDKYNHKAIESIGWLPLLTMVVAFLSYGVGLNSVPHTLTSEMYSTKVRGLGSSISLITAWLSGLLSILVSGYLNFYLGGHYTFWLFGGVNAAAFVFVVLFIPETTAKTLTEIDYMMAQ